MAATPPDNNNNNNNNNKKDNLRYNTFVKVKSNFEAATELEHDDGCSLQDYMRLPVDQYVCIKMPLNAELKRIDESFFNLTVPPVTFFNLQVSPTVQCVVSQTEDAVVIQSNSVHLSGSPYVESLNGCYKIRIQTIFNWKDSPAYKGILSRSEIDVDVDPPPPFKYFGKRVLETTGTLAMTIALRQIENAFVTNLGADFARWARNPDYRRARASASAGVNIESSSSSASSGIAGAATATTAAAVIEEKGSATAAPSPVPVLTNTPTTPIRGVIVNPTTTAPVPLRNIPVRPGQDAASQAAQRAASQDKKRALNQKTPELNPGLGLQGGLSKVTLPPIAAAAMNSAASAMTTMATNGGTNKNKNGMQGGGGSSDDTPASLLDEMCLVPGEPIVRVEEAPDNARRIFTGIDIPADIDAVWDVLTDYERLGEVIPSLVKNEVVARRADGGARLSQVGGAKIIPGVTFTAKTVLDVSVYLEDNPIPDDMTADHLPDAPNETAGDREMRDFDRRLPLQRGVFPRPYVFCPMFFLLF
jgi:hypothetical protein